MKKLFVLALAGIFSLNFLIAQNTAPTATPTSKDKKEVKQENKTEKKSNKKTHKTKSSATGKDAKVEKKSTTAPAPAPEKVK